MNRPDLRTSSLVGILVVVLPALAAVTLTTVRPDGVAHAAPIQIDIGTPGPLGAVTVFGDSVLLGSALYGPTLPDRLAERGWGPIRFRAGEGYKTGSYGTLDSRATYWFGLWRSQGWDAPNVLVNLGANDSGVCDTNLACARDHIMDVVDAIGPGRQIWWPQITRLYTAFDQQDNWNLALRQIAAERPDFHTWDWPAELPQYNSYDNTHLDAAGYRARSFRMAELFTIDVARGRQTGPDAPLPSPTATPSTFMSVPAERIVDTRVDPPGRQTTGSTLRVDFGDTIPPDATAVALYVAAAGASVGGFLAAGPCGTPNGGATVNFAAGVPQGAPAITALGDGGDVCITTQGDTNVVVDLQGAFVAGDAGLRLEPLATPERLVDTRVTGRSSEIQITVPANAKAVTVNLAAAGASGAGFLSAYPCGAPSGVANVNYRQGPPVSGSAIVTASDAGTVCVSSSSSTDVIVDIAGTFREGPGGGLAFVPVTPTRTLDTRTGVGGWSPIHGSDQTIDVRVAPASARAVTGTLTVVNPLATTFVAGYGCVGVPPNSSVNAGRQTIAANSLTSGISDAGRLCLLSSAATATVFDTTGWWIQ